MKRLWKDAFGWVVQIGEYSDDDLQLRKPFGGMVFWLDKRSNEFMLNIEAVNHVGIRITDKLRSLSFYQSLGFDLVQDAGFEEGHPLIVKHPSGVVLNLLGPATATDDKNILMDVEEKYPGYTHIALTVSSLDAAKVELERLGIELTGSFSFGEMSAVFIRDPDRNVIELDAYSTSGAENDNGYAIHH